MPPGEAVAVRLELSGELVRERRVVSADLHPNRVVPKTARLASDVLEQQRCSAGRNALVGQPQMSEEEGRCPAPTRRLLARNERDIARRDEADRVPVRLRQIERSGGQLFRERPGCAVARRRPVVRRR